jgi:hypothetical protein
LAQVHTRAILFDYLWSFGLGIVLWADRWIDEVESWKTVDGSQRARQHGVEVIRELMSSLPVTVPAASRVEGPTRPGASRSERPPPRGNTAASR